jgi:hypothetical protein
MMHSTALHCDDMMEHWLHRESHALRCTLGFWHGQGASTDCQEEFFSEFFFCGSESLCVC